MVNNYNVKQNLLSKPAFILFCICVLGARMIVAKTVVVKPQGDTTDITSQFGKAIKEKADTFIVPYSKETIWETNTLWLKSNFTFILEPGVILFAKRSIFPLDTITYALIRLNNIRDVNIIGYGAVIKMRIDEYMAGEWRHGIFIEGCKNIRIKGLSVINTGGDGICINLNSELAYSQNVSIEEVTCDGNARQGISVISCKNLRIDRCTLINTGARNHHRLAVHGPWAGIDLEPDHATQFLENVWITNCSIHDNKGDGILYAFGGGGTNSVYCSSNKIYDNKHSGIALIGKLRAKSGELKLSNNDISGKQKYGIYLRDWNKTAFKVKIDSININASEMEQPIFLCFTKLAKGNYGGIEGKNLVVSASGSQPVLFIEGQHKQIRIRRIRISGTLKNGKENSVSKPFLFKQ
jgi:hypothetical protein